MYSFTTSTIKLENKNYVYPRAKHTMDVVQRGVLFTLLLTQLYSISTYFYDFPIINILH